MEKIMRKIFMVCLAYMLVIGLASPTSVAFAVSFENVLPYATQEEFKIEVTVEAGDTFHLPTAGLSGGMYKDYAWDVDWGDGVSNTGYTNTFNPDGGTIATNDYNALGIPHTYTTGGVYIITIEPNGSTDAWLGAFGFATNLNADNLANKAMLTDILSEFTPLMMRTPDQIVGVADPPVNEWCRIFERCTSLKSTGLGFSSDWATITTVNYSFCASLFLGCTNSAFKMMPEFNIPQNITNFVSAGSGSHFQSMFAYCNGTDFTMNEIFNLPQGITAAAAQLAYSMFSGCNGTAFTMNDVFNLPPQITTINEGFASYMFYNCSGASFTMNEIFNLPQGITTLWGGFARIMFGGCSGTAFLINDVFRFPPVAQREYYRPNALRNVFYKLNSSVPQKRSAVSIINNPSTLTPPTLFPTNQALDTFTGGSLFCDLNIIQTSWGGLGMAPDITITYDRNGMSEVVFPVEASGADQTTLPARAGNRLGTPVVEYASTYTNHTWYTDPDCEFPWDFATDVAMNSLTLYAYKPAVLTDYSVLEHFGTFYGTKTLAAKVDADDTKFVGLWLEERAVSSSHYTISAGSTIITLKESYLKTLANGDYAFTAEYTDGVATPINLKVNVSDDTSGSTNSNLANVSGGSPSTGDLGVNIVDLAGAILILSLMSIACGLVRRRKATFL